MATGADFDPELAVIHAIQRGDQHAFRELLRRQDRWVRGVIYAVLGDRQRVDDVSQAVWTAVWERVGELRDAARWKPWLYRLARNAAIDARRERVRRRQFDATLADEPPEERYADPPADALADRERRAAVMDAIAALPEIYREPFTLRHLEGWNYRQIGELLDLPVDTVETRLVRARRQLRDALRGKVES